MAGLGFSENPDGKRNSRTFRQSREVQGAGAAATHGPAPGHMLPDDTEAPGRSCSGPGKWG